MKKYILFIADQANALDDGTDDRVTLASEKSKYKCGSVGQSCSPQINPYCLPSSCPMRSLLGEHEASLISPAVSLNWIASREMEQTRYIPHSKNSSRSRNHSCYPSGFPSRTLTCRSNRSLQPEPILTRHSLDGTSVKPRTNSYAKPITRFCGLWKESEAFRLRKLLSRLLKRGEGGWLLTFSFFFFNS